MLEGREAICDSVHDPQATAGKCEGCFSGERKSLKNRSLAGLCSFVGGMRRRARRWPYRAPETAPAAAPLTANSLIYPEIT